MRYIEKKKANDFESARPTIPRRARPLAIDLFSGVGGLSLGFEQAGFDVVAALESDPIHASVHRYNFPLTPVLLADARNVSGDDLLETARRGFANLRGSAKGWRNRVHAVFGGSPCQGYSSIGGRDENDERNLLIFEFARLVREIRPRYFAMENVVGIIRGKYKPVLERFSDELKRAGYVVAKPIVLNAAEHGVPQHRERVFVVGWKKGQRPVSYPAATTTPVATRKRRVRVAGLPPTPTVGEALLGMPDIDSRAESRRLYDRDEVRLTKRDLRAMKGSSTYARILSGFQEDPANFAYRRSHDQTILSCVMLTKHAEEILDRFGAAARGTYEPISRFFKLDVGAQCNTLRAGTGYDHGSHTSARPIHHQHPRVITVREAARLHSFPDWFRFHRTKWHGFLQVGNSVPPLLARAIGREILRALAARPTRPALELPPSDAALLDMSARTAAESLPRHANVVVRALAKRRGRNSVSKKTTRPFFGS